MNEFKIDAAISHASRRIKWYEVQSVIDAQAPWVLAKSPEKSDAST